MSFPEWRTTTSRTTRVVTGKYHEIDRGRLYVPYLLEFRTDGEQPVIHNEYFDVPRAIALEDITDGPDGFGTRMVRIEGETLIIESSGFEEHPAGLATDFDYSG
jgi:hypothetical protein